MDVEATSSVAQRTMHVWVAAQIAVVLAAVLSVLGFGLAFVWAHATTPTEQVILITLMWPALLIPDISSGLALYASFFALQFTLMWFLAFTVLRCWALLQTRSNSTVERDARKSGARPSP